MRYYSRVERYKARALTLINEDIQLPGIMAQIIPYLPKLPRSSTLINISSRKNKLEVGTPIPRLAHPANRHITFTFNKVPDTQYVLSFRRATNIVTWGNDSYVTIGIDGDSLSYRELNALFVYVNLAFRSVVRKYVFSNIYTPPEVIPEFIVDTPLYLAFDLPYNAWAYCKVFWKHQHLIQLQPGIVPVYFSYMTDCTLSTRVQDYIKVYINSALIDITQKIRSPAGLLIAGVLHNAIYSNTIKVDLENLNLSLYDYSANLLTPNLANLILKNQVPKTLLLR